MFEAFLAFHVLSAADSSAISEAMAGSLMRMPAMLSVTIKSDT